MAKTNSLVAKLTADYPAIRFVEADDSYWSSAEKTVYYAPLTDLVDRRTLLHELAHGLLDHVQFDRDIQLLKMERDAWTLAQSELGPAYGIVIDDDYIDTMLDTYRDWIHNRSRCPVCTMNGVQREENNYLCLGCNHSWRVNDARRCQLRRHTTTQTK